MNAETLYRQLGRLIETAPDFSGYGPLNTEQLRWLGEPMHSWSRATMPL
jgi:hypothetical protein